MKLSDYLSSGKNVDTSDLKTIMWISARCDHSGCVHFAITDNNGLDVSGWHEDMESVIEGIGEYVPAICRRSRPL